jgi:hypothetical protein
MHDIDTSFPAKIEVLVILIQASHCIIAGKHMLYWLCVLHLLWEYNLYIGMVLYTRRVYFGQHLFTLGRLQVGSGRSRFPCGYTSTEDTCYYGEENDCNHRETSQGDACGDGEST